ncbi:MAG TPA: amidohydrolase [Nocardioides sp.]|uniref:amidohydrolase n=1 Tax=Nocardioides sp. TaxID=35761 RepID=UPI002F416643
MTRTLFTGGSVFDGHRHLPRHGLLIDDGKVVDVLTPGELDALDRRAGQVIDRAGGLVSPGFTDAHCHPIQGGLERLQCDLTDGSTRQEYLAMVGAYAGRYDGPWITGGGWAMAAFPGGTPSATDLDTVVPDRPVFLPNRDHHGAWVNSRALELAGITRETPDPPDGRIERLPDGSPQGTLHEGAMDLVAALLPLPEQGEYAAGLVEGQRYLFSLGVTAWQDAIVGAYAGMADTGSTYCDATASGDLVADVVGALWWDRELGLAQVPDLVERRRVQSGGRFRATSVKIMQDGVCENFTAAMLSPYLDGHGHATGNAGHSFVEAEGLKEVVVALAAEGFQVHVHAIGDRGVREALDAFAASRSGADLRHHIAHIQVIHPDDVPRFAALGVAANAQALWACHEPQMDELTIPFLGEERTTWQYPFGGLHRAGARLVMGSDWPVSSPDPIAAIHTAVTRTSYDDTRDPFLPEQALDLTTAFAAYTSGSAWVNGRDRLDGAGVLAPGHTADLAVLDRDPFAGPVDEIGATQVVSTWVGGAQVHHCG